MEKAIEHYNDPDTRISAPSSRPRSKAHQLQVLLLSRMIYNSFSARKKNWLLQLGTSGFNSGIVITYQAMNGDHTLLLYINKVIADSSATGNGGSQFVFDRIFRAPHGLSYLTMVW